MRPRPRRSSNAARPSSASGGCAIALSPTASRKPATACSPSHGCRQVSGEAREQRTRSSVCTKSSSGGSRRRPCCRRQKRQRCCSGRCSPLIRSTCARLMVGRPSPQSPSISRLTSPPDQILSKCRRSRHQIPTPLATAPFIAGIRTLGWTHVGHCVPMGAKQTTHGRKLATVAQPCGYPVDGQMDCLHHALVGIAGSMTLQQFDLYMVERIEVGKAVLDRARQQGILVEQCLLAGDNEQHFNRILPFGTQPRKDSFAQLGVLDELSVA